MSEPERQTKAEMPVQVFLALDRRDENQILAEIRGEIIEDLVYDTTIQGRRVTNLSYAGVKEAVRHRGNVEILDVHTEEVDGEIRALVRVRDLQNRIDVLGASSAEKTKPFAYTLVVNKAERNAFAKLIPAKWLATLIKDYLSRKEKPPTNPIAADTPSAAVSSSDVLPRAPITIETLQEPGLSQLPLIVGKKTIGMLNVFEDEISIVPEKPLRKDGSTIAGFLVPKILDPMCTKHDLTYRIAENANGEFEYILIAGKFTDTQIKELQTAARWAFSKAIEKLESELQKQP